MELQGHEYYISKESCGECITLFKKALEKWRDYYVNMAKENIECGAFENANYDDGKADLLEKLLNLFDDEQKED